MHFVRETATSAAEAITDKISNGLEAGNTVLWLVSGGSNITYEVAILRQLQSHTSLPLNKLTILLMDERYGSYGHSDSNSAQLRAAGFDTGNATYIDVLAQNLPFSETVAYYSDTTATALAEAQLVVGQFGIGDDGHIAGIKPNSPAVSPGGATVIGYNWDDYERMTMSVEVLQQIHVAYALAYGDNKAATLRKLQEHKEPFEELPAVLLFELPEAYVYNDYIKSEE